LRGVQVDFLKDMGTALDTQQEPSQLCLEFSEGKTLAMLCGTDGESIRVGKHPYSVLPQQETQFEVVREDQGEAPQWMVFVGRRCEDVVEVRDLSYGGKGIWCGVELLFEGGSVLTAYNWGDALLVSAPPEDTGFLERVSVLKRYPLDSPEQGGAKGERAKEEASAEPSRGNADVSSQKEKERGEEPPRDITEEDIPF
jgi:hypothetical protein